MRASTERRGEMATRRSGTTALRKLFTRPTLRDYHRAGIEAAAWVRGIGYGNRCDAMAELGASLSVTERLLWELARFGQAFDEGMVGQAAVMEAHWNDVRRFLRVVPNPKDAGLEELRAIVDRRLSTSAKCGRKPAAADTPDTP